MFEDIHESPIYRPDKRPSVFETAHAEKSYYKVQWRL